MKKTALILIMGMYWTSSSWAQYILNGSFENNNYQWECAIDMYYIDYNPTMENSSIVFTPGDGIISPVSLISNDCTVGGNPWGGDAQDGEWFVMPFGHFNYFLEVVRAGAFSLELSEALSLGTEYQLSYWMRGFPTYSGNDSSFWWSVTQPFQEMGSSVEIGLTLNPDSFGVQIHQSEVPGQEWMYQSFTFVAQSAAQHISCRIIVPDTALGAEYGTMLDNFVLSTTNSIKPKPKIKPLVYPNPNTGDFYVEASAGSQVQIRDLMGRLVLQQDILENTKNYLQLTKQKMGIYVLEIFDQKGQSIATQKLVLKN